jgi:membrane-bound lytic murein transglycosylase B
MKRFSAVATVFAALAACVCPAFAQTQTQTPPQTADTSKPIVVKQVKPKSRKESFKGEVLNVTAAAITVRSRTNEQQIRTFTFSPAIQVHMQQIMDAGGYQYGDRVTVEADAGSNVALRIKGRPSKSM